MRICHCHAVTDREIRAAHESGARTVGQVARACGAGRSCGGCVPAIAEVLECATDAVAGVARVRGPELVRTLLPVTTAEAPVAAE